MERSQILAFLCLAAFVIIQGHFQGLHNVKFLHNGDLMPVHFRTLSEFHNLLWVSNFTGAQKVHLGLGVNNTQMVVSYVHNDAIFNGTYVYYGTKSCIGILNCTYEFNVCGNNSLHTYYWNAGIFADVLLSNLIPQTKYYYIVGNHNFWTSESYFYTPPQVTPQKTTFAVYGDMGIINSNITVDLIKKLVDRGELNAVLHMGDISYADNRETAQYEQTWDIFFDKIEPIASRVPYMVCPGNHEYPYNFTVYNERFLMPGLLQGNSSTGTNMYHSFDYANIHFTAISTESTYAKGSPQFDWIDSDLSKAAARKAAGAIDWIIVIGHKPMYCSYNWTDCCGACNQTKYSYGWDTGATSNTIRVTLEEFLVMYNVDLYLSGHVHAYERMWPVYDQDIDTTQQNDTYINPEYPVHIVSGAAGCIEAVPDPVDPIDFWPPQTVSRLSKYGFGKMDVYENKAIHWQFIGSNVTYAGEVLDEFWIYKQ